MRDNEENIRASRKRGTEPYFLAHNREVVDGLLTFDSNKLYDKGATGKEAKVIHQQYVKITRKEIIEKLHSLSVSEANEEAYIVFPDGKVLHRWCDSANSVSMYGLDLTGTTIYHNHPTDEGINEKDILVAYIGGAHSINAICPEYRDVVTFRKSKRIFEGTAGSIMIELEDRAKRKLNSKEYDKLLQGGIHAWSQFMCKEMKAIYHRIGFQK